MDANDAPTLTPPSPPLWRVIVGTLAGVFLGGVLLYSLVGIPWEICAKLCDPASLAEVIAAEKLEFSLPVVGWRFDASTMAIIAIGLETGLGLSLVLWLRRLWILVPASALVLFFVYLTGRAYLAHLRGEEPGMASCGCFGNLADRTPAEAFWQDLALLVPAALLMWVGRLRGAFPWRRLIFVVALLVPGVAFAVKAPDLDLDEFATRLKPGVALADMCVGEGDDRFCLLGPEGAPEFEQGRYVVIIADLADESFGNLIRERLDGLLAWGEDYENPMFYVLHAGEKEEEQAFNFRSGMPPFQYRPAPQALLRPLYRALPRTFVVVDGRVTRTYSGFPPLDELRSP